MLQTEGSCKFLKVASKTKKLVFLVYKRKQPPLLIWNTASCNHLFYLLALLKILLLVFLPNSQASTDMAKYNKQSTYAVLEITGLITNFSSTQNKSTSPFHKSFEIWHIIYILSKRERTNKWRGRLHSVWNKRTEHFLDINSYNYICFEVPRSSCPKTFSPPTVANTNLWVPEVSWQLFQQNTFH